jgi:hypothetical protein
MNLLTETEERLTLLLSMFFISHIVTKEQIYNMILFQFRLSDNKSPQV